MSWTPTSRRSFCSHRSASYFSPQRFFIHDLVIVLWFSVLPPSAPRAPRKRQSNAHMALATIRLS